MEYQYAAVLRAAARQAFSGRGTVVLLSGETGLGKSTTLRAIAAELDGGHPDSALRVLTGACDDIADPPRLGPLREAGWPIDLDHQELLSRLAATPTALLVDDIQWADDATLELLGYLARRIDEHPLLVVLTLADDSRLPERLRRRLGGLAAAGVKRLPLAPLTLDEVRRQTPGADAEHLYALTGGNPFHLSALIATPSSSQVPDTVCDVVLAKTTRLSRACRTAVEQLAVLPGTIELELVEQLTGGGLETLAEAEQYGLLMAHHEGIGFRHEIVRLAIEQTLPRVRRWALHKQALDVLARQGDLHLNRMAHHAVASADVEAIARYAPRAGRKAAMAGARDEALLMFDEAWKLGVLPTEFTGEYARELFNSFRFTEAIAAGLPSKFHYFADPAASHQDHLDTLFHELRWDELDRCLDEPADHPPAQRRRSIFRCLLQLRRGDWNAAEAELAVLREGGPDFLTASASAVAARLLVRRGAPVDPQGPPSIVVPALIEQAYLVDDVDRIARLRDEWRELEATPVWTEIRRYCVRAGLEPSTDGWAGAAQEWERLGDTYELALELAESGETGPTVEALRLLEELGARPAAELVRRRLRKLGLRIVPRGPSATTRAHPAGLTARQADVLALISEGFTNAEIAERLVLSVRTVDHHVSAILTRLDVPTRHQAAAVARRTLAVA